MKAEILRTEGTMVELLNPFMIDEFKRASSVLVDYNLPEEIEIYYIHYFMRKNVYYRKTHFIKQSL